MIDKDSASAILFLETWVGLAGWEGGLIIQNQGKSPLYYPIYLFQNPEFHQTVEELTTWLESTTDSIRSSEPVDLRVDRQILEQKLSKFKELYSDLLRCEPRIVSLQEAADQLELQYDGDVEDEEVLALSTLKHNTVGIWIANI